MQAVVPMAVGAGIALAPLYVRARRSLGSSDALAGGPFTLAMVAIVTGVLRLAPLVYPINTFSVRNLNMLNAAIKRQQIHRALVLLPSGAGWPNDGLDLTMNLPVTLYPDQDVLIAMEASPDVDRCLREHYSDRTFYTALPGFEIRIKKD
jgi:hypothetical protein